MRTKTRIAPTPIRLPRQPPGNRLEPRIQSPERNEESIRASEERFRLLVEGVKDYAIFMLDPAGNILTWNSGAERIIGYTAQEVTSKNYALYFPPEDVAEAKPRRELEQAAANGSLNEEGWRVRKDGSRFWSHGVLTALYDDQGKIRGFATVTRDLTERMQAEEDLRASNERFRLLVEGVKDYAIFMLDPAGNIVTWNSGAELIFGYKTAEVIGHAYSQFFRGDDVASDQHQRQNELDQAAAEGRVNITGWRVRKDGSRFWANGILTALYNDNGELRGFAKITRDLTEQHGLWERLKQIAAIVESSDDAIIGMNVRGIIESWNPAAERAYGYSATEAIGKPFTILVLPENVDRLRDWVARLAKGEPGGRIETVRVRKDGQRIDIAARFSPILNSSGSVVGVGAISRDISKRKILEAQLYQSQKMEAFGQLAGGVAHDFNNLLTVITGYSQLLVSKLPKDDPKRAFLEHVVHAGERAASLTRQLLAFSRQQVLEPKVLDLNAVINDTEAMLQRLIGEDIQLTAVLSPTLSPVKVDPGQIEQVIINLAVNARDAMPQGGKLTIETQNVELDKAYAKTHFDATPGRYVLVAISDTGCGMTPEVKARIFEPFFTTKGVGKGTGLGLAVVQGIVKQSGGNIEVYSEVGTGTTFRIYLPAEQERPTSLSTPELSEPAPGTETILLVEDDEAVRVFSAVVLQGYGYTVLHAASGKDALRVAESHEEKIDLLVTDVVMPELCGDKLADALRTRYPDVKVLFLSGYMDDAVVRHGILQHDVAFLQKPFTPASLARKVRGVLDQR